MWIHELLLCPCNSLAVSLLFSSEFISTGNVIPVTCRYCFISRNEFVGVGRYRQSEYWHFVHAKPVYVGASVTLEFLASGRSDATSDVCFIQTKSNYLPSFTLLSVVISHSFVCLHCCWSVTLVSSGDPYLHHEGGSRVLLIKFGVHLRKYAV
jgi:hypothetical protein